MERLNLFADCPTDERAAPSPPARIHVVAWSVLSLKFIGGIEIGNETLGGAPRYCQYIRAGWGNHPRVPRWWFFERSLTWICKHGDEGHWRVMYGSNVRDDSPPHSRVESQPWPEYCLCADFRYIGAISTQYFGSQRFPPNKT